MNVFSQPSLITITCHKRMTPYLVEEIKELGFQIQSSFITGVQLEGTVTDCIRLNLHLRCASQVLYQLKKITARHPDDIYKNVTAYNWENIIPEKAHLSVTSNVHTATINNNMFASLRVKDAIVDRLRAKRGQRPDTGSALTGTVIHLFWKNEDATIFIDTSGDSLSRHGYRKIPGKAPMLESLAAATIFATGWKGKSPFINPMCGSGTLAIEAAMIATNRKPGLFRTNYAFMHLQHYNQEYYFEQDALLETQIKDVDDLKIIASDIDENAITNARKNAIAAGVEKLITFQVCDYSQTKIPEESDGVIFFNPEYGERLGDVQALQKTYKEIGDFLKQKCKGYRGYIFTGNIALAKKIGLRANRKIEFYNSTIDCRLLEYELYSGSKR